jgi:peptidoglycan/xylan/chitin deacetylase (PgdA/CDA1 family)
MKKIFILIMGMSILLSGCGTGVFAKPIPTATITVTVTPLPPTDAERATITPTSTITPTFTPSPVPTPTWVHQGPDAILVPILMYHHIEVAPIDSPYRVSTSKFEGELKLLHDWEYTTITTEMLVKAITEGMSLPPRPIIITFDDGNIDNYTNAFPIMQKYGFTGVIYIVSNRLQSEGYMNVEQIKEMAAAGWEVGSHSVSHPNLSDNIPPEILRHEIVQSRQDLETALNLPVLTFAYPFGTVSGAAVDYVKFAGYIAGMGATGFTANQERSNLFVLQRCEIKGSEDAKSFIRFLPWHGDPIFLPTDTPTPTATPSRTPIPTYTLVPTQTPAP